MNDLALERRVGAPPPLPDDAAPFAIHPLFPLPEGVRETKEVHSISFDRWDHQGRKERCPDRFLASDLTSLAQVIDMFGGGTYQFFAFDRRGNYSRWTAEKDKVRVNVPCKPFRPIEGPPASSTPAKAPAGASGDLIALLLATQERTDRMILALLDHLARVPAVPALPTALPRVLAAPAAPPPVQAVDPLAMMISLATVLEKLRPPSGGMDEQLRALAMVAEQMGKDATPPPVTAPALPVTAPASTAAPAPTPPPEMVWAEIPGFGPALMRPEQAQMLTQRPSPPPSPSIAFAPTPTPAPVMEAQPRPWSWDEIVQRLLKNPVEQLAVKAALERTAAEPPRAPGRAASAPVLGGPVLPEHAASAPAPVRAAPAAPVPIPEPPRPVPPPFAAPVPIHAPISAGSTPRAPIIAARSTPLSTPAAPSPPCASRAKTHAPTEPVNTPQQADGPSPPRRARSRSRLRTADLAQSACSPRSSWLWRRAGPQPPPDAPN